MIRRRQRRRAGRVVVRSTDGRVLLFRGGDPARPEAGTWWVTPGGGVDPGESTADAARRELLEETGLDVPREALGPVRMRRRTRFEFAGTRYKQHEDYYLLFGPSFDVDTSRWSPLERQSVVEWRWWPIEDLRTTEEKYYPETLVALIDGRSTRDLPRIALLLLGLWSFVVLLNGLGVLTARAVHARGLMPGGPNHLPAISFGVWVVLLSLWGLSLNVGLAGFIVGLIAILRDGWRRLWRALALAVVVVGGGFLEFVTLLWRPGSEDPSGFDFVHDGGLGAVLTVLLAIAVMGLSALLLTSSGSARRRARSSASPSPPGGTAP